MNKRFVFLILLLVFGVTSGYAYHYRSRRSAGWFSGSTWDRSSDGSSWSYTTASPNKDDDTITIQDNLTLGLNVDIDQTTIVEGARLRNNNRVLTVYNGDGDDLIINGILDGGGTFINNNGAQIVILNNGKYEVSGTMTNNGIITIHNKQLSGTVNNYGTIKSDRVDIMRSGSLTNYSNSTIEYTSVINIPASTSYKRLKLSAPGIYYLTGDVTNLEYLELGPNTYLHKNGFNLDEAHIPPKFLHSLP